MKKLLSILVLSLLLIGNAFAKKPLKIEIYSETDLGGLYGIKYPLIGTFKGRASPAYKEISNLAEKNCKNYNKNSFIFFKEGYGTISVDSNGELSSHENKKGIIPDYATRITKAMVFRFFCGTNIKEVVDNFTKRSEIFSLKKFNTSSLWGNPKKLLYFNQKNKEFELKEVSQEMINKIQISKSNLPKCFGSPNKSWTACYGVDENDNYKYEGEYGGYDKVSEGILTENLIIKRHGYGKATFKDIGVTYEGNFFDNDMNGFGIAKWNNGATHIGQWKLNEPYGQGKFVHPDGKIEEGFWNNGIVKKN
jgi:hypothetical protein